MATRLDDQQRLRALAESGLSGMVPNEAFDRLTQATKALLNVPVSLVSYVGPERQFLLSCAAVGEPWSSTRETPISHSFCQHCVVAAAPFVVDDARLHPLVRGNPAIEELGVIAYAGVPITTADGSVIGTLCAIDSKPRAWTDEEIALLSTLGAAATGEIARRAVVREFESRGYTPREDDGGGGANIAAVARRTGIVPPTLRKWEERYGIPKPSRSAGGQRIYSEDEIAKVEWLKARLAEGYRIGAAVAILRVHGEAPAASRPSDKVRAEPRKA